MPFIISFEFIENNVIIFTLKHFLSNHHIIKNFGLQIKCEILMYVNKCFVIRHDNFYEWYNFKF